MGAICEGVLCVTRSVEPWLVRHFGLQVEIGLSWQQALSVSTDVDVYQGLDLAAWQGLIHSVHLPFGLSGRRLNIAALDEEWRSESLLVLTRSMELAGALGAAKAVVHTAPYRWDRQVVGDYEFLIDGLRHIGRLAEGLGLTLCVENNRTYWDGCQPDQSADEIDRSHMNEYFSATPAGWLQLWRDVDMAQVLLCLDTSHAVTTAQLTTSLDERLRIMEAFLAAGDAIAHVHWNDNYFGDNRGRADAHRRLDAGSIPLDIHRQVCRLRASKHLEHPLSGAELLAALGYIREL